MQRRVRLLLLALVAALLTPLTTNMGIAVADANPTTITICTSLKTGFSFISKTGKCNPRIYEARTWYKLGTAPLGTPGSAPVDLITCQSKGSTTQIIRSRTVCNRTTQVTARWQRPVGPAGAPSISSVVMGLQGTATLKIEPPVNDGGSRITSYIVTTNPGGVTTTFTPAQIKAAQITGLKPGTTYSFSTVAVNAKSPSPLSTVTTPALAPTTAGTPTITSVVATGTNTAQLTFTAPADNGGSPITSYVVTAMPGGLRTTVSQAGGGTINISNLSPSTNYTFTITANNAAGASSAAPAPLTITTATPPPPPAPVAVAPSAPANTVISVAAIAGVTAPVTGATPVTTTTAGTGYTGAITWSGSPSTFASVTTYTATITLTVAAGYTLTGVTANFFTIAGATTVTHSANSGVITAVFPDSGYRVGDTGPGGGVIFYVAPTTFTQLGATGSMCSTLCKYLEAAPTSGTNAWTDNSYAWSGNTSVAIGATAQGTAVGTGFRNTTAIVGQSNGGNTADRAGTVSRAFRGPNSLTDWYLPSKDELNQLCKWQRGVTGEALTNLTTRCTGGGLNTGLNAAGFQSNIYRSSTETENSNSVHGQNFSNSGDPGQQYTVLDKTQDNQRGVRPIRAFGTPTPTTTITTSTIAGVTAPVTGATPVTAVTADTQFTGTVTWASSGGALVGNFVGSTTYTATITLTPTLGYTLTGVTANFFTVAGTTTVTHSANAGVVTAVFPATALAAPAFTLSAASETRSVNITATGFTVISTGGAATFAISPSAPAGMSFNTTTGAFSGTPTSVAAPTAYTVTASNATGPNATQNFTLTVVGTSNKVAITRASVGTERRTAFTTQPQITVQDSAGNTITSSSDVVTASVSAGGTLVGTITATAASGIATFTGLGVDGTIGTTYTITYTVAGLAVATVTVALTGTSCDGSTFTCQVGDTGPSGGTIFYAAVSTFTCGPTLTSNCRYLEAAPTTGTGAWIDASYLWSGINNFEIGANAQGTAIGTGYKNTEAMVAQTQGGVEGATGSTPNRAGTISLAYSRTFLSVTYDDWFLPSKDELNQLRLQRVVVGINSGNAYWSSTEVSNTNAHSHRFSDSANGATNKSQSNFVRPIRAF